MHLSDILESVSTPLTLSWERLDDRSPLSARVAANAARLIVERRYEAGSLVTEADLALEQGVSRTPAREAMLQLESWALVRLLPKKGAVVRPVTLEERRDLLAVRAMFEVDAVTALTNRPAEVAGLAEDLERQLERQREALGAADPLSFASADYAFHARIIHGGGNSVVAALLDTLGPRLARMTYLAAIENPRQLSRLLAEHEQLAQRARAGDPAGFATLVREHITAGHSLPGDDA